MSRLFGVAVGIVLLACGVQTSSAQTTSFDVADRFAFGGPADGSYRLYDRATGKLVAQTDALLAQVYVLPEGGVANAYVVLAEGSEDGWAFSVRKVRGPDIEHLFAVDKVDGRFEAHDLNGDSALDFTFYASPKETEFVPEISLLAQRDYISGAVGYREEVPACGSARAALAQQRIVYAIDRHRQGSRPATQALGFLNRELERLTRKCPAG